MTLLFKDTFTAADGTTLATHASDSGHSYAALDQQYAGYTGADANGNAPPLTSLQITGNELGSAYDPGFGDGSSMGAAQVAVDIPLDQVTITFVVVAGLADDSDWHYLQLMWPQQGGEPRNILSIDTAGYLGVQQIASYYGLNAQSFPDQLDWVPGSSHTVEFTIGDGSIVLKDNGAVVATFDWKVLPTTASGFNLAYSSYNLTSARLDSLQIDSNALGPSPTYTGPTFAAAPTLPSGTAVYQDTFTAADGTTLATHVADSGQAYALNANMQTHGLSGSGGSGTPDGLLITAGKLGASIDVNGDGSYCGTAAVAVTMPVDDFCVSVDIDGGNTGASLVLLWPILANGDPSPYGVSLTLSAGGQVQLDYGDSPNGITYQSLSYNPTAPVEFDPAAAHTVQVAAFGGTVYVVIDGTTRASGSWPAFSFSADHLGLGINFGGGAPGVFSSIAVQLGASGGGGTGPQTGHASGFATTAFGTPTSGRTLAASGIASATTFGVPVSARPFTQDAQASGIASGAGFGAPTASTSGAPAPAFTFTETFTDAANTALSAHVADTGQAWSEPNGVYSIDAGGARLLPCFNANAYRAGALGYLVPSYAIIEAVFLPPTTGSNPFTCIVGFGDNGSKSFYGGAGLFFNGAGNVQLRFYNSNGTFFPIASISKAALGTAPVTLRLEPGRISVNGVQYASDSIAPSDGTTALLVQLYSNTSVATARPYLDSVQVAAGPISTLQASGIQSTATFGIPTYGILPNLVQAETFRPTRFATPNIQRVLVQPDGFHPVVFGTPSTPTRRSVQAAGLGYAIRMGEAPTAIEVDPDPPRYVTFPQPRRMSRFGVPRKL